MDVDWVTRSLSSTYWAKGRDEETMRSCMAHSLNFALIDGDVQIAYARVVTDYTIFAYLLDVYVDTDRRRHGHGFSLVSEIMNHQALKKVKVWRLRTTDQHALYRKFGFRELSEVQYMMELKRGQD